MSSELLIHYEQEWQNHFDTRVDAPWLTALRRQELAAFMTAGIPTTSNEQWKYTNLVSLQSQKFSVVTNSETVTTEVIKPFLLPNSHACLVFVDGMFVPTISTLPPSSDNIVMPFAQAIRDHEDKIRDYLEQQKTQNVFAHLNTAYMQDGAFIYIPQSQEVATIQLLFLSKTKQSLQSTRNLIVVGANAKVNVVEEHYSLHDEVYKSNVVTQIHAEAGAQVEYLKIQKQSLASFHIANTQVQQKQDSTVNVHGYSLGAQLAREDIDCYLEEKGSTINIQGLYLPLNHQHIDLHTTLFHNADHTTSKEYFKGVLAQKSRAVFNGKVIVNEHIQKAMANLQNKNLLLTQGCEVNTKPELEIYADDVKCSHGATIGQIDPEMLFYLRSRGVDQKQAYRLLLSAFVNENIAALSDSQLIEKVKSLITKHCEELVYE